MPEIPAPPAATARAYRTAPPHGCRCTAPRGRIAVRHAPASYVRSAALSGDALHSATAGPVRGGGGGEGGGGGGSGCRAARPEDNAEFHRFVELWHTYRHRLPPSSGVLPLWPLLRLGGQRGCGAPGPPCGRGLGHTNPLAVTGAKGRGAPRPLSRGGRTAHYHIAARRKRTPMANPPTRLYDS